jgi:hypothetical protein
MIELVAVCTLGLVALGAILASYAAHSKSISLIYELSELKKAHTLEEKVTADTQRIPLPPKPVINQSPRMVTATDGRHFDISELQVP